MRLLGSPLELWDVRNVEAHVRRAVDAGLAKRGARLNPKQHDRLLQFCLQKCWELSGLESDGKTLRIVWEVRGFIAPAGELDAYEPIKLPQFGTSVSADLALDELRDRLRLEGRALAFVSVRPTRPSRAYDPSFGLKFSTYSYRHIVAYSITDWYREDEEFGDTRYEANCVEVDSLEAMSMRTRQDGDEQLGTPAPIGRLEVIDQLNQHAYLDQHEEVLTREAFGF